LCQEKLDDDDEMVVVVVRVGVSFVDAVVDVVVVVVVRTGGRIRRVPQRRGGAAAQETGDEPGPFLPGPLPLPDARDQLGHHFRHQRQVGPTEPPCSSSALY